MFVGGTGWGDCVLLYFLVLLCGRCIGVYYFICFYAFIRTVVCTSIASAPPGAAMNSNALLVSLADDPHTNQIYPCQIYRRIRI